MNANGVLTVSFQQEELFGEVVDHWKPVFENAFSKGVTKLVLDMTGVENIGSVFIAMLLVLHKQVKEADSQIRLVGVGERVGRILESVRTRQLFEECDSVDEAIRAFR